jgi:hypothetical protein
MTIEPHLTCGPFIDVVTHVLQIVCLKPSERKARNPSVASQFEIRVVPEPPLRGFDRSGYNAT